MKGACDQEGLSSNDAFQDGPNHCYRESRRMLGWKSDGVVIGSPSLASGQRRRLSPSIRDIWLCLGKQIKCRVRHEKVVTKVLFEGHGGWCSSGADDGPARVGDEASRVMPVSPGFFFFPVLPFLSFSFFVDFFSGDWASEC